MNDDQDKAEAAAERLAAYKAVTADLRRARMWAELPGGISLEITEQIVDLLDMIHDSMNWGSGFWTDSDLESFIQLCQMLHFEEIPEPAKIRQFVTPSQKPGKPFNPPGIYHA